MTDETTLLRSYVQLAEDGSFTGAASSLCISQPSLSARIRKLEISYGFPLFLRNTRKVELSPQGRELLPLARQLLNDSKQIGAMVAQLQGHQDNRLRVCACPHNSEFRWRILEGFIGRHPEIVVQVELSSIASEPLRRTREGDLDVAFTWVKFDPAIFDHVHAYAAEIGIVMPKESRLAQVKAVTSEQLAGETIAISHWEANPDLFEAISPYLARCGAEQSLAPEVSFDGMVGHALHSGVPTLVGIPIVDGVAVPPADLKGLVYRPFADIDLRMDFNIIRNRLASSWAAKLFWRELPSLMAA